MVKEICILLKTTIFSDLRLVSFLSSSDYLFLTRTVFLLAVNSVHKSCLTKHFYPFEGIIYPPATTVGKSTNIVWQTCMVKKAERQKLIGQKGCVVWITGLSGSGSHHYLIEDALMTSRMICLLLAQPGS